MIPPYKITHSSIEKTLGKPEKMQKLTGGDTTLKFPHQAAMTSRIFMLSSQA